MRENRALSGILSRILRSANLGYIPKAPREGWRGFGQEEGRGQQCKSHFSYPTFTVKKFLYSLDADTLNLTFVVISIVRKCIKRTPQKECMMFLSKFQLLQILVVPQLFSIVIIFLTQLQSLKYSCEDLICVPINLYF